MPADVNISEFAWTYAFAQLKIFHTQKGLRTCGAIWVLMIKIWQLIFLKQRFCFMEGFNMWSLSEFRAFFIDLDCTVVIKEGWTSVLITRNSFFKRTTFFIPMRLFLWQVLFMIKTALFLTFLAFVNGAMTASVAIRRLLRAIEFHLDLLYLRKQIIDWLWQIAE